MPVYTGVTGVAFFAALGLPGLSAFICEVLVLLGAVAARIPALTIVAASAVVLTAGYMLWALQRMFLGQAEREVRRPPPEINGRELVTLVPLAVIVLVLGVYPKADPRPASSPRARSRSHEQVKAAAPAARVREPR